MSMPIPPPLLHTRSGNEMYDRPHTPTTPGSATGHGFTSPVQTPQGSPSKKQFPPGANDLPNVFDNAMKLAPMSPTKMQPQSPTKAGFAVDEHSNQDPFADPSPQQYQPRSESPTRQSNKENAPAGGTGFLKGVQQNHAANAREQQYRTADKKTLTTMKGLTTEELQKLQLPKIKRLANVTQLCMYSTRSHCDGSTNVYQISSTITSTSSPTSITARREKLLSSPLSRVRQRLPRKNMTLPYTNISVGNAPT